MAKSVVFHADAAEAIKELENEHGIDHLDIVYANVGIATVVPKASEVKIEDLKAHFQVNFYAVVTLLQATPSSAKERDEPEVGHIGSQPGYLNNFLFFPNSAYGPSKVAVLFMTRSLGSHHWSFIQGKRVQTDLVNAVARIAAKMFGIEGLDKAVLEIPTSMNGFVKVVDETIRDTHSGKLWTWEGNAVQW
ncbi:hypothetical protein BCR34DRAFT_597327 [Clohesyomyces aquaticus]|uniref:Uncharacterized protein n=1 Tax=Clohesyomyces aquaticus TaxID=1231657 RepID=A0A1Y2A3B1_9PLEO|nr:hypothetical protein BCR34DRAFT_597327 [Clohesyomyces aquaticus]